jgi:uncharacterized DUF497 family protein
MYQHIEKEMREATRSRRVILDPHAQDALEDDNLRFADVLHCLLTGAIVSDQYDERYGEMKYEWRGEARDGREIALIAKLTYTGKVYVITVYWLRWTDYD